MHSLFEDTFVILILNGNHFGVKIEIIHQVQMLLAVQKKRQIAYWNFLYSDTMNILRKMHQINKWVDALSKNDFMGHIFGFGDQRPYFIMS